MDLKFCAEEIAFRNEVRGWLRENIPADLSEEVVLDPMRRAGPQL